MSRAVVLAASLALVAALGAAPASSPFIDVTVHEGTSMSVAVSPDGRMLAIDMQGSIWTLPSSGGAAKRITDLFNDARQPTWSPDGRTITFFAYRDGGYDIWSVAPDGSNQRKLTWGPYDDREPAWSPDGQRVAFSSDRSGSYDVWVVTLSSGDVKQITADASNEFHPSWRSGSSCSSRRMTIGPVRSTRSGPNARISARNPLSPSPFRHFQSNP